ncbi:MAG: hypothetical protein ABI672_13755, partial [Vicinamibacteria bacterium]
MKAYALCSATLLAMATAWPMNGPTLAAREENGMPAPAQVRPPTAKSTAPQVVRTLTPRSAYQTLEKYCVPCHGAVAPEAGMSVVKLMKDASLGTSAQEWEDIAERLEKRTMPPKEALAFPSDDERTAGASA